MSGPIWTSAVRARIASSLADLLASLPLRQVAELVGCSSSSVHRRGDDLAAWPAADLLSLAQHHAGLREALLGWLADEQAPAASPVRAVGELHSAVRQSGLLIADIAAALSDGRVTPTEASDLATRIRLRREAEIQLLADLDAIARGGR